MSPAGEPAYPTLETARLVLWPPAPDLAPALAAYFQRNEAHFAPAMPRLPASAFTEEPCRQRLALARAELVKGTSARFVVFAREAPELPIGDVSLTNIVRGPFLACHLGYKLDAAVVGRGYMTEALRAVTAYAFDELGLHRLMANYVPTNERSARVLRRLGFAVEGYARHYLYLDGAWRDHVLTSLTNPKPVSPTT